jgi:hypothetical protein
MISAERGRVEANTSKGSANTEATTFFQIALMAAHLSGC